MKTNVIMAWSGGKDGALALHRLRRDDRWNVVGLLTTLTCRYDRVQMHGVRRLLLLAQAEALGLPVAEVWVPPEASNDAYEAAMGRMVERLKADGIQAVAFGDLHLADIRTYRERMLAGSGVEPLFPVWGEDTATLARQVIDAGYRATLVCVDGRKLPPSFLGRTYDEALLADLPEGIDPCGENGEFHTYVHNGPDFRHPVHTVQGVAVERNGFHYADLLPLAERIGTTVHPYHD